MGAALAAAAELARAIQIVTPDTVVRGHTREFARYGRLKSRPRGAGLPAVALAVR